MSRSQVPLLILVLEIQVLRSWRWYMVSVPLSHVTPSWPSLQMGAPPSWKYLPSCISAGFSDFSSALDFPWVLMRIPQGSETKQTKRLRRTEKHTLLSTFVFMSFSLIESFVSQLNSKDWVAWERQQGRLSFVVREKHGISCSKTWVRS